MWLNNGRHITRLTILPAIGVFLCACEASLGPGFVGADPNQDAGGIIVADEPQAVIIAQEVLSIGGSAADAAVALGFGLSGTLHSSAGLGGGGICLVYDAVQDRADALSFVPVPATGRKQMAERDVAVPALARGLYALHAEHGKLPWQQVVAPAENLVRSGVTVSRALARDLYRFAFAFADDPTALDVFMSSQRTIASEGDRIDQLDLTSTLSQIRGKTSLDFYSGALAQSIDSSAKEAGVSLSYRDLHAYAPRWGRAESVQVGNTEYYRASAFERSGTTATLAETVSGRDAPSGSATTGFVVADADRNVVACSLTMLSPFGIGLVPTELGFLLAPSPTDMERPAGPLIVGIVVDNRTRDVQYAAASSGQDGAHQIDTSVRLIVSQQSNLDTLFVSGTENDEEIGGAQINALFCERGMKAGLEHCAVKHDPNGHGFGTIIIGSR